METFELLGRLYEIGEYSHDCIHPGFYAKCRDVSRKVLGFGS